MRIDHHAAFAAPDEGEKDILKNQLSPLEKGIRGI
jgi:hypothetical protein